MPNVECFQIGGCRCWFYSDDHRPAHFHASSPGEWEARVYFLLDPPEIEMLFEVKRLRRLGSGETCLAWLSLPASLIHPFSRA